MRLQLCDSREAASWKHGSPLLAYIACHPIRVQSRHAAVAHSTEAGFMKGLGGSQGL